MADRVEEAAGRIAVGMSRPANLCDDAVAERFMGRRSRPGR